VGGQGMRRASQYKWLIVVEGNTDIKTYEKLLVFYNVNKDDVRLVSAHGKGFVCNSAAFSYGFDISEEYPKLPNEPNVIHNIKSAIGLFSSYYGESKP
jgi:hypothetical protein